MTAYYNEHDKNAAAWLRELIKAGLIAEGEVDERSVEDVTPNELTGFTPCHFFAGIGVWSYALRKAGWPDDRPVWTGSCPCQPFSAAGKGKGTADERHLWPALYHLIRQCKPSVVFGEQVASKDGLGWLDIVQADLEAARYSVGAVDLCAAGLGAPHIRQRLFWVGHSEGVIRGLSEGQSGECSSELVGSGKVGIVADAGSSTGKRNAGAILGAKTKVNRKDGAQHGHSTVRHGNGCSTSIVADHQSNRRQQWQSDARGGVVGNGEGQVVRLGRDGSTDWVADASSQQEYAAATGRLHPQLGGSGDVDGMADTDNARPQGRSVGRDSGRELPAWQGGMELSERPGPTNGFWGAADWLQCRDGKWRAVEPGTFPLVNGTSARVGRLRGYGNAIVAPVAQAFIESYLEAINE